MRDRLGTLLSKAICKYVPDAISRVPLDAVSSEQQTEKILALTFDDGPTNAGTPELLEVLAANQVPATFFLLGENAQRHPERVKEMVKAGHVLGNHSQTHIDGWNTPFPQIVRELVACTQILEDLSGQPVKWMRPPYGKLTKGMVRWARRHDQGLMFWDVMPPDFKADATVEDVVESLTKRIRSRSIIVMHDNPNANRVTPQALRETLPLLIEDGWKFVTL